MSQHDSPECRSTRGHTTSTDYRCGCRCPTARAAATRRMKSFRLRAEHGRADVLVDGTGTRRRLEALLAIGWPGDYLGERLGIAGRASVLRLRRAGATRTSTAARVAALYAELSDRPGPSRNGAQQATRFGYAPPIAWDDDTLDDPAASPAPWRRNDTRRISGRERAEDILWLRRGGVSDEEIAARIGIEVNTVRNGSYLRRAS